MKITDSQTVSDLANIEVTDTNLRHVRISTQKRTTASDNPFGAKSPDEQPTRNTNEFANNMEDAATKCRVHEFDNNTNYIYLVKTYDLLYRNENGTVLDLDQSAEDFSYSNLPDEVATVTQRLDNFKWSRKNGWRRDENKPVEFRTVEPFRKADSPELHPVVQAAIAVPPDAVAPY